MAIARIQSELDELKAKGLNAVGAPTDVWEQIAFAPSPDPKMGDVGFPCFALARHLKAAPPAIAERVAEALRTEIEGTVVADVVVAGPYVNFRLQRGKIASIVVGEALEKGARLGADQVDEPNNWMIEYSAPNTNKPQHLGHVRNNLLGATVASILRFVGHDVTRVNLINDRGIHICKSMLAYKLWGNGETPESTGEKGDHLVGRYYVKFQTEFSREYAAWAKTEVGQETIRAAFEDDEKAPAQMESAYEDRYFNTVSELGLQAKEMLRKWEQGDEEVVALWNMMNGWVFAGFDETYARLGVGFERTYRESETYLLGKDLVQRGVDDGKFVTLPDGAVACDLEPLGLTGQKILLRNDGTSVYMTQDLGTALARFEDYPVEQMAYVVGNEQDHHFRVLFAILGLIRPELAGHLFHLSYGMVELPDGKMKSREGKVVDADDLIQEMVDLAEAAIRERYSELSDDEVAKRAEAIGPAALKYYIMDFNPKTTVNFDPQKSISFEGRTGPYCLYSYARIQSIGKRLGGWPDVDADTQNAALESLTSELETAVIDAIREWPRMVALSARLLDPSKVTEQLFKICKAFSTMYNDPGHRIVDLEGDRKTGLLLLSRATAEVLKGGLELLGIEPLEAM